MRTMTLPASLAESLQLLRTEVKGADLTNWHSLLAHSDAYIRTLRSNVKPGDPELPNAFGDAGEVPGTDQRTCQVSFGNGSRAAGPPKHP